MKFSISFKDSGALPDCLGDVVHHDVEPTEKELEEYCGDLAAWKHAKRDELEEFVAKWVEWGEYIRIEFDTEKGTATVQTVK